MTADAGGTDGNGTGCPLAEAAPDGRGVSRAGALAEGKEVSSGGAGCAGMGVMVVAAWKADAKDGISFSRMPVAPPKTGVPCARDAPRNMRRGVLSVFPLSANATSPAWLPR